MPADSENNFYAGTVRNNRYQRRFEPLILNTGRVVTGSNLWLTQPIRINFYDWEVLDNDVQIIFDDAFKFRHMLDHISPKNNLRIRTGHRFL